MTKDLTIECRNAFLVWMHNTHPTALLKRCKNSDGYEYTPACYLWKGFKSGWELRSEYSENSIDKKS